MSRIDVERIVSDVTEALTEVATEFRGKGVGNPTWTCGMKRKLSELAMMHGYVPCASGREKPEWLYDICWQEELDGTLLDLPLVVESEWRRSGINYDFRKLLVARARLRVMIFESRNRGETDRIITDGIRQIRKFEQSRPKDRFLFAALENSDTGSAFYFQPYTHQ